MMSLRVERSALSLTVQDGGRFGFQRFGLPESGPVDWWAQRGANILVGNDPDAACVEIGFSEVVFTLEQDALLAVCGAGFRVLVDDREIPLWIAFWVRRGTLLHLEKVPGGNWVYLAVKGGICSPKWLGSRSVYPRAGLGQPLRSGDCLPLAEDVQHKRERAGRAIPLQYRPMYGDQAQIGVIPGPHTDHFTSESVKLFWDDSFQVSHSSDRMGYRLVGERLENADRKDLISQGLVQGALQVPADGQPIAMMPDHPTTGGYPIIGCVIRNDFPLLAQSQPGVDTFHFRPVSVAEAQTAYRKTIEKMSEALHDEEDLWLNL